MATVLVEYWILLSWFVLQEDVYYCNMTKYVCLVDGLTDHNNKAKFVNVSKKLDHYQNRV